MTNTESITKPCENSAFKNLSYWNLNSLFTERMSISFRISNKNNAT